MRILILATNPDFSVAQPYLTLSAGDEISLAAPDDHCLETVRRQRPDLVLIDENTPWCNGYRLADEIHDDLDTREIPVMVVPGLEIRPGGAPDAPARATPPSPPLANPTDPPHAGALTRLWSQEDRSLERQVLDYLDHGVMVTDLDGKIIYWNQFAQKLFGFQGQDVLGKRPEDVLGKRGKNFRAELKQRLETDGRWVMEYLARHFDGRLTPVLLHFHPLLDQHHRMIGIIETSYDITERKEDESRYQRALFNAPFPVVLHAEDGEILMINRAWTEYSGYEPGHIPRIEDWLEKAYPNRQDAVRLGVNKLFDTIDRVVNEGEFEITTRTGAKRIWEFNSTPLGKTRDGRRIIMSMAVDLTDRKEAENQMRRAIEDAPYPILIHTSTGRVTLINHAWTKITGYQPEDIPTLADWMRLAYGDRLPQVMQEVKDFHGEIRPVAYENDYEIQTKDKRTRIWNFNAAPLGTTAAGEDLLMVIAADITERRAVERRFELAIQQSPFPIALYTETGETVLFNEAWENIAGYRLSEAADMQTWVNRVLCAPDSEVLDALLHKADIRPNQDGQEFHLTARGGQALIWDLRIVTLGLQPDGRKLRMAIASDITERRELERRFERAVMEASYPIALYADDGEILLVNRTWTEISGYTLADIPTTAIWAERAYRDRKKEIMALIHDINLKDGRLNIGELVIYTKDGMQRVWDFSSVFLGYLKDGRRFRMSIVNDVTEHKHEEERFRRAVLNAPYPISLYAEDGEMLLLNDAWTSLSGYTLEDIPTNRAWVTKAFGEQVGRELLQKQQARQFDGRVHQGEYTFRGKDGRERVWDFSAVSLGNLPDGRTYRMAMAVDLTERRRSQARFEQALHNAPLPIMLYKPDGEITLVNDAWLKSSGYGLQDLPNIDVWIERAYADRRQESLEAMAGAMSDKGVSRYGELQLNAKDGSTRWWDYSATWLGDPQSPDALRMVMGADVTERRAIQERFQRAVMESPNPIIIHNSHGKILLVNRKFSELSGFPAEQTQDMEAWLNQAAPSYTEAMLGRIRQAYRQGGVHHYGVLTIITAFGGQRKWDLTGVDIGGENGEQLRMLTAIDLTERDIEQERFEAAVNSSPSPIMIHAEDGRVLFINPTLTELTGYTLDDIPTLNVWIHKAYPNRVEDMSNVLKNGYVTRQMVRAGEFEVTTAHGRVLIWDWITVELNPLPDGRRTRMSVAMDVTERKNAEAQLRRAVDNAPYPIIIHAEDGEILSINRAFVEISGYALEDIPTMNDWVGKAYPGMVDASLAKVRQGYDQGGLYHGGEVVVHTATGRLRNWIFTSVDLGRLLDGRRTRMSTAIDVTGRRESERRFELAVEEAPYPIMIYAEDGEVISLNQAFTRQSGYTLEELPTLEKFFQTTAERDAAMLMQRSVNGQAKPTSASLGDMTLVAKDGRERVWETKEVWIGRMEDGRRLRMQMAADITDRKQMEANLRASEEKYRAIIENSIMGILIFQDNRVVFANKLMPEILNIAPDDLARLPVEELADVILPEDLERLRRAYRVEPSMAAISAGSPIRIQSGEDEVRWVEFIVHQIAYAGQPALQVMCLDVTASRKAEQSLKLTENRYRQVVEFSSMLIAVTSGTEITFINPAGAKLLGFDAPSDMIGLELWDVVHPDCVARLGAHIRDLFAPETPPRNSQTWPEEAVFIEQEIVLRDGQRVVLGASVNFLTPEQGKPVVHILAHDFTARRQARQALQRQAVLGQVDISLEQSASLQQGLQKLVEIVQPAFVESSSLAIVWEEKSSPGYHLVYTPGAQLSNALADRLTNTEAGLTDYLLHLRSPQRVDSRPDDPYDAGFFEGSPVQAYIVAPLLIDQRPRGLLFAFADREHAFTQADLDLLEAVARRLTDAVGRMELLESLRQARDAAEQASQAKADFLANMSHELRTPLTTITTISELLLDSPLDAVQVNYTQAVYSSAARLLDLINRVLDFSRLEAQMLTLETAPFDLRRSIEAAFNIAAVKAASKNLELDYTLAQDVPCCVLGDQMQLGQVLVNLLANAVKFTEAGSVTLEVSRPPQAAPDELLFVVRDTGIGIPPGRIPDLFKPFSQVDTSPSRRRPGTGLGLVISKHLVELMGGRIWAESDGRSGSTFSFTIIAPATSARPPIYMSSNPALLREKTALLASRYVLARRAIHKLLTLWGMNVFVFSHLEDVEHWLQDPSHNPDVALLDADFLEQAERQPALAARLQQMNRGGAIGQVVIALLPFGQSAAPSTGVRSFTINPVKPGALFALLASSFTHMLEGGPEVFDFPEGVASGLEGERILLAEDDLLNRQALTMRLERLGYQVQGAANGLEVIQALAEGRYAIVFMDYQMPEMNGLFATRYIRENYPADRQPFIIALTADARPEAHDALLSAGANICLTKPVRGNELAMVIQQAMTHVETERRLGRLSASLGNDQTGDPIDEVIFNDLAAAVGGPDMANLAVILDLFFTNSEQLIADILEDWKAQDWAAMGAHLHTLKGSVELLGATRWGAFCKQMELNLSNLEVSYMDDEIERLLQLQDEATRALRVKYDQVRAGMSLSKE